MILDLPDQTATETLARRLAAGLRPGDTLALDGPLGIGKSCFARALIRALAGAEIEVPSPTFNLVLIYDTPAGEVWHVDLYRLAGPDDAASLGLDDAFGRAIAVIEWPDRLGPDLPPDALTVALSAGPTPDSRRVRLDGPGWDARLAALLPTPEMP